MSGGATAQVGEVKDGRVITFTVHPRDLGLAAHDNDARRGGAKEENAEALRGVLAGQAGPLRDFTLINAAAALIAADLASDFQEGLVLASRSIDSGNATRSLEAFVKVSNEV